MFMHLQEAHYFKLILNCYIKRLHVYFIDFQIPFKNLCH